MPLRRVAAAIPVFCLISLGFSSCVVRRGISRLGKNAAQPLAVTDKPTLIAIVARNFNLVRDFNVTVNMTPSLGSAEKNKITEYKDVTAHILFRQPADIRILGLYPVIGGTAFDMVSNGSNFKLSIPSQNRFLVGKNEIVQRSARKLENLRPQHFLEALLVRPIASADRVMMENFTDEDHAFYWLNEVQDDGAGPLVLKRQIWFSRLNLTVARQLIFDDAGNILSDTRYDDWHYFDSAPFPKHIEINRPQDEYGVVLDVVKMYINRGVTSDKFALNQPPGYALQVIGQAPRARSSRAPASANKEKPVTVTARIVLENLKHKPVRSLLSILLIGVPVTLILCLVGLSHGMLEDTQRRTRAIGADIIVRPPSSSLLSTGGAMPEAVARALEKRPHVKLAVGVVNALVGGVDLWAVGVDLDSFTRISGGFKFRSGGPFQHPDDVMIDEYYAAEKNAHVGSYLNFLNKRWRVCGIFQGGMLSHVVFPLRLLQDLSTNTGKVSQIYLKLDDPANARAVIESLKNDPGWAVYKVYSMAEFTALFSVNNIPGLKEFVWVIVSIGVIIGFAVMCLSMYMAVLQRTREIGILKSLGGSSAFILRIVLAEALIMGVGGTILGIGMSFGAWWLIRTLLPASIPMVIVYGWWPIALGITLVGTFFGALYPGLTAARHDPIEALAYE